MNRVVFCVLEHSCVFYIDAWVCKPAETLLDKRNRLSVGACTVPAVTYILYHPLGADYLGL